MNYSEEYKTIRGRSWDEAIHTYGTAHIFEKRAGQLKHRLKILTFLGIVVPTVAGSVFLSFGVGNSVLTTILGTIAGILGTLQLVGSIWSLTAGWENDLSYALESMTSNYRLAYDYENIAHNPPSDFDSLKSRFSLLEVENRTRSDSDNKRVIKEIEKRRGMHAALRQHQRACVECGEVPKSMEPSDCNVCGRF